jgi:hypothetical protein
MDEKERYVYKKKDVWLIKRDGAGGKSIKKDGWPIRAIEG